MNEGHETLIVLDKVNHYFAGICKGVVNMSFQKYA